MMQATRHQSAGACSSGSETNPGPGVHILPIFSKMATLAFSPLVACALTEHRRGRSLNLAMVQTRPSQTLQRDQTCAISKTANGNVRRPGSCVPLLWRSSISRMKAANLAIS